jgi:Mlc titration factor MtfA (ptsG expression regulator)
LSYYLALLLFFGGLGSLAIFIYIFVKKREDKRLKALLQQPFDEECRSYLLKIPHYKNLSDEDKKKIERSIVIFTNTKEFIGVDIELTQEMKVIIAFYACLLLLHKTTTNCYDNLKTIIIYPSAVAFENVQASGGIYTKEKFLIDGQAANDTVIIIWNDAKKEAYHLRHDNVIVHEFAHEIDFMDGEVDGIPPIEKSKYDEWTRILFGDYQKLSDVVLKNREWGKYKLLGSYAATNEAEFFAVVSERFFEAPASLKKHFPELYNELRDFYKIDTLKLLQE